MSRVVGCAPVPKAWAGSMTTGTSAGSGSSQGGPTQSGPIRTGLWNARQRSDQSGATSSPVISPKWARSRASPSASVYAASSISPVALHLLEAGRREVEERRAGDLRLVRRHTHSHAAQAHRNVLFRRAKKP